jgi:hypothetical protein
MSRETLRSIAVQDGARKILSGEYETPQEYFNYFVDHSLFQSENEYALLVQRRAERML